MACTSGLSYRTVSPLDGFVLSEAKKARLTSADNSQKRIQNEISTRTRFFSQECDFDPENGTDC